MTTDEARAALLATLTAYEPPDMWAFNKALDALIAAVRAEVGADANTKIAAAYERGRREPLDVEVLARALEVIGARWDPDGMELAPLVAAEYARLEAER